MAKFQSVKRRPAALQVIYVLLAVFFIAASPWSPLWRRHRAHGNDAAGRKREKLLDLLSRGKRIEWLHLPKTGTTFGNTLIPWACPGLPPEVRINETGIPPGVLPEDCLARLRVIHDASPGWRVGGHVSLLGRTEEELGLVFTMIRPPAQRLASGYHQIHGPRRFRANEEEICEFARTTLIPHAAIAAQSRMIAGARMRPKDGWRQFLPGDTFSPDDVAAKACRRLPQLAFVGLSPHWAASICLFHAVYGGRAREDEMENVHEGRHRMVRGSVKAAECGDVADERLYHCAQELFLEQLLQLAPQCVRHLQGGAFDGTVASVSRELERLRASGSPAPAWHAAAVRGI